MKMEIVISGAIALFLFLSRCNSGTSIDTRSIASDSVSIANGEAIFRQNCSSCHNFKVDGISPQLGGLTTITSVDWIKNFIKSPKTVIESGDERAQRLIVKYNALMPSFDQLTEDEINEIIAFLHTQKAPDKQGPSGLIIPPDQIRRKSL